MRDDLVKEQIANLFIENEAKGTGESSEQGGTNVRPLQVSVAAVEIGELFGVEQIVELSGECGGREGPGATERGQVNAEERESDVQEGADGRPNWVDSETGRLSGFRSGSRGGSSGFVDSGLVGGGH